MPAKKKPSKFLQFAKTNPDTNALIEYIIAESLIKSVKFNGVDCVDVYISSKDMFSITKDAKEVFERLKIELSPSKIN